MYDLPEITHDDIINAAMKYHMAKSMADTAVNGTDYWITCAIKASIVEVEFHAIMARFCEADAAKNKQDNHAEHHAKTR